MSAGAGKVTVAYLHPGEVSHSFLQSMMKLWLYEQPSGRIATAIAQECGSARIIEGRNDAVRVFLASESEWLLFIDSDMGFEHRALEQLLAAADPVERPIVGGLAFGQRKGPGLPTHGRYHEAVPTLYAWRDGGFAPMYGYREMFPPDAVVKVDGTGAAFLLIHRSVLERMAEANAGARPREWFDDTNYNGTIVGEDLTFCLRAGTLGFPIYVHTGVKTSHYKSVYYDEATVAHTLTDVPTFVVIPFKDRVDLTSALVTQLRHQGGFDAIFLMDNGSTQSKTANWLASVTEADPRVEVYDCAGLNIHEMWNLGLRQANSRAWRSNVAVLNNDISIGPGFLDGLASTLRRFPFVEVVSPNYDGRDLGADEVVPVSDICAGRYDGTGGLAGFAFMLKGERPYRFPTELQWWYGDTDLLASVHAGGLDAVITGAATCEHVKGGSQTGRWSDPDMQRVLEADRAWFEAKWHIGAEAA